jgi:outer membrane lipoprotein-sorting protein
MPAGTRSRSAAVALAGIALHASGCASAKLPGPEIAARARATATYSASVRFSVSGADLRGRGRALLAFERPDRLRVEVPGPTSLRLVAVIRGSSLLAVFPSDRAVFRDAATATALQALFGLSLAPGEIMDVLVGAPPPSLRSYRARWGAELPRSIDATLADGTRLKLEVESADRDVRIPEAAFEAPPHDGYRDVDTAEARSLWGSR